MKQGTVAISSHEQLSSQPGAADSVANSSLSPVLGSTAITLALRDARGHIFDASFRVPPRPLLLSIANRLLKNAFPGNQQLSLREQLIKSTIILPKDVSKKFIDILPINQVDACFQQLWISLINASSFPQQDASSTVCAQDEWFTLFLLWRNLQDYRWEALLEQDLLELASRDTGVIHGYYYQQPFQTELLKPLLEAHDYRTDLLPTDLTLPIAVSNIAYLACKKLSYTLPWSQLLESLTQQELDSFPRLKQASILSQALFQQEWTHHSVSQKTLSELTEHFHRFMRQFQKVNPLGFTYQPLKLVIIVEGETERLLLPIFASVFNLDFEQEGIQILPAGGKNHVPLLYEQQAQVLNCPIFVLLDQDAQNQESELAKVKRPEDQIFVIPEGEFEDTYDLALVIDTINHYYHPYPHLTVKELQPQVGQEATESSLVQTLKLIWQGQQWGSFDKISFALQYGERFQALAEARAQQRITVPIHTFMNTLKQTIKSE